MTFPDGPVNPAIFRTEEIHAAMREQERREAELLAMPLVEITESEQDEMLNVLPPMHWTTNEGVGVFCMCEMQTGDITSQYGQKDGRFFTKYVDARKRQTWINSAMVEAYIAEEASRDEHSPMPKSAKLLIQNALAEYGLKEVADRITDAIHANLYWGGKLK